MAKINDDRIAYKNAEEKAERLFEYLKKFKKLFPQGTFDYKTIENKLNGEEFEDVILLRSRVVEYSSLVCELYGKYLLLAGGKTWGDAKRAGHNINNLYNALSEEERSQLDIFILRAYKRIGGDLSDLDSLSEQAEMNRKVLVSNKTMIANISIDESYKKKKSPVENLFNYMMKRITGYDPDDDYKVPVVPIDYAVDEKVNDVFIRKTPNADLIEISDVLRNGNKEYVNNVTLTHPVLEEYEPSVHNFTDVPTQLSGIFSGNGQPLGVRARYTQDLLRDISNEEIMFLISMAYGLVEYSQQVYEASKQVQTNGD